MPRLQSCLVSATTIQEGCSQHERSRWQELSNIFVSRPTTLARFAERHPDYDEHVGAHWEGTR